MTLTEILEAYRLGERGLPTYAELVEIRRQYAQTEAGWVLVAERLKDLAALVERREARADRIGGVEREAKNRIARPER